MSKLWSKEEVAKAAKLYRQGIPKKEIARRLGRTYKSVAFKLSQNLTMDNAMVAEVVRQNAILKAQLDKIQQGKEQTIKDYNGEMIRFGVLSDTHIGSAEENVSLLKSAYQQFQKEGIQHILHAGDLLDGENVYRGHVYEIHKHGLDAQVEYAINQYPKIKGTTTWFILGNHDLSFWKTAGIDVGRLINEQRQDMHYLGPESAEVTIDGIKIRLVHPGGGTAYAISYHPQQYINSIFGGEKPNLIIMGHYHKAEMLFYRNVHCIQAGCIQYQTKYMERKRIAAMMGFWILEIAVNEGIIKLKSEWFPCYV